MWTKFICRLLTVQLINDVRQTETHTAESLVPGPGSAEGDFAGETRMYKQIASYLLKFQALPLNDFYEFLYEKWNNTVVAAADTWRIIDNACRSDKCFV